MLQSVSKKLPYKAMNIMTTEQQQQQSTMAKNRDDIACRKSANGLAVSLRRPTGGGKKGFYAPEVQWCARRAW